MDRAETQYFERLEGDIPQISFDVSSGEALPFIRYDQASQQFHVNEAVVEMLLDYQGKMAFVFNIGEASVGKSFFLNKVLDLEPKNSFEQNSLGLTIWSRACVKDSEDLSIFFVDCQTGTKDRNYETFVMAAAMLLGSVTLYHSYGPIDRNTWASLETLERLKTKVRFAEDDGENEYALSHAMPQLLWLMRDFDINFTDSGGKLMTADNYVDMELRDNQDGGAANDNKMSFINLFKERLAFAVPRPRRCC